jgi:hypothetical protein
MGQLVFVTPNSMGGSTWHQHLQGQVLTTE